MKGPSCFAVSSCFLISKPVFSSGSQRKLLFPRPSLVKLHEKDPKEINLESSIVFLRAKAQEDKAGSQAKAACGEEATENFLGSGEIHSSPLLDSPAGNHSRMPIFTS